MPQGRRKPIMQPPEDRERLKKPGGDGGRMLKEEFQDLLRDFRRGGCRVKGCGEAVNECLTAHHLNPNTKRFTIGRSRNKYPREMVEAELAKCVPICMNCHAKLNAGVIEDHDIRR